MVAAVHEALSRAGARDVDVRAGSMTFRGSRLRAVVFERHASLLRDLWSGTISIGAEDARVAAHYTLDIGRMWWVLAVQIVVVATFAILLRDTADRILLFVCGALVVGVTVCSEWISVLRLRRSLDGVLKLQ